MQRGIHTRRAHLLAAVIEGTKLLSRPPVSALERFSGCFFRLAYTAGVSVQTLPDPSTYLVVEVPESGAPRCVISGARLKSMRSASTEAMQVIGIRLRPGVAYLLTGAGAEQWAGRREPLSAVLGTCVDELATQVGAAPHANAQFDLLEAFLVARLTGKQVDGRVCLALHLMQQSRGAMRVAEIAQRCGPSSRQLERLLRLWVGISPKVLARIARFQAAMVSAGERPATEWAYVAAEQNYADQAHLIHEFSDFTGASPTRFAPLNAPGHLKANCE
jgi:AraC-like DNA-binding protein